MQSRLVQLFENEVINRRLHPCRIRLWQRNWWAHRRFESPMWAIHRSLTNPLLQGGNLCRAHRLGFATVGSRHPIMRIIGLDPLDQFTFFRVGGNNRVRTMRALLQRPFRKVQAETRLSHFGIWTVTTETTTREDWLDVLIKIQTGLCATTTDKSAQRKGRQK